MIYEFKSLTRLFEEINATLHEKVEFFMIGGAMLLYHGMKRATKDIDIIVTTRREFLAIKAALKKLNFDEKIPTKEYKNVDLSQIYTREDFRIDIFQRTVCNGFCLSETMKKRAQKVVEMKNFELFLCSHEDVFLFKTFTEREGDIQDCLELAQKGLAWEEIISELENQINLSGNNIWITWIGERLDILQEHGLDIPIMGEINRLREDYFNELERTQVKKQNTQK